MARITIVGAGIIGMATAALLSREHEVTVVARNLPGDEPSIEWASPWAGVSFIGGGCTDPRERKMQADAFAELWRWSARYPEASIRRIPIKDVMDEVKTKEDIWWSSFVPDFRYLRPDELPEGAKMGITYTTIILHPGVFLPWLRRKLEQSGVQFHRMTLTGLSEARRFAPDVVINATGVGSRDLLDVKDPDVEKVRGQTIVVRGDYDQLFMRDDGKNYTYVIPRMDGTIILGGIRQPKVTHSRVDWEISKDIVRRIHKSLPDKFSADLADYDIVGHNVGIRPGRSSGIRVEKEVKNGQNIVHAYGFSGGGYIFSFGAARAARDLVEEFLFPTTMAKL